MDDETSAQDVIIAWQDATLATDLAERLTMAALDAGERAEAGSGQDEAIASLAAHAAESALAVAAAAGGAADRARDASSDRTSSRRSGAVSPTAWRGR